MNILFTICGRAGSKGFKNKNCKSMREIPLVYYALAVVKMYIEAHKEDKITIAVNTDSIDLINIVKKQKIINDIVFVERKESLADDKTAKVEVIKDTYLQLKQDNNYDVVIDLDITSPYRKLQDLENIIKIYCSNSSYDLVYSVVKARRNPYFNMVEERQDGFYKKVCESNFTARQQAPQIYELNASIYAYRPQFLESDITKTILDYNCGISEMNDYYVLDIDSEEDYQMMCLLHPFYCEKDNELNDVYEEAKKLII